MRAICYRDWGAGFRWVNRCVQRWRARQSDLLRLRFRHLYLGRLPRALPRRVMMSAVFGFGIFALMLMAVTLGGGYEHQFDPTNGSGVEWIPNLLRFNYPGGRLGRILAMQYRTRKTLRGGSPWRP